MLYDSLIHLKSKTVLSSFTLYMVKANNVLLFYPQNEDTIKTFGSCQFQSSNEIIQEY